MDQCLPTVKRKAVETSSSGPTAVSACTVDAHALKMLRAGIIIGRALTDQIKAHIGGVFRCIVKTFETAPDVSAEKITLIACRFLSIDASSGKCFDTLDVEIYYEKTKSLMFVLSDSADAVFVHRPLTMEMLLYSGPGFGNIKLPFSFSLNPSPVYPALRIMIGCLCTNLISSVDAQVLGPDAVPNFSEKILPIHLFCGVPPQRNIHNHTKKCTLCGANSGFVANHAMVTFLNGVAPANDAAFEHSAPCRHVKPPTYGAKLCIGDYTGSPSARTRELVVDDWVYELNNNLFQRVLCAMCKDDDLYWNVRQCHMIFFRDTY